MGLTPGRRAEGRQGQSQEKWRMEGGERRADTGRTTKGYGGRWTADGEKFLLHFSNADFVVFAFFKIL